MQSADFVIFALTVLYLKPTVKNGKRQNDMAFCIDATDFILFRCLSGLPVFKLRRLRDISIPIYIAGSLAVLKKTAKPIDLSVFK